MNNEWKMVPVTPTDEMLRAAGEEPEDWPQQHWEAMLAAAPVPPAGDVEVPNPRQSFDAWFTSDLGLPPHTNTALIGEAAEPWRAWKACSSVYSAHVTRMTDRADKNWRALIDMRDERDKALEDLRLEKVAGAAIRQQAEDFKALSWERGQELTKARELLVRTRELIRPTAVLSPQSEYASLKIQIDGELLCLPSPESASRVSGCADAAWLLYDGGLYGQHGVLVMPCAVIIQKATSYAGYQSAPAAKCEACDGTGHDLNGGLNPFGGAADCLDCGGRGTAAEGDE